MKNLTKIALKSAVFGCVALLAACGSTPDGELGSAGGMTSAQQAEMEARRAAERERIRMASLQAREPQTTPGTPEHFERNVKDRIFFDLAGYQLDEEARGVVQMQAAWLRAYPNQRIIIEGHCDERGTREYNLALGARRASAVRDYLISLGVDPQRIQTVTFGKERPVVAGSDETSYRLNRRSVTRIRNMPGS